MKNIILVLILGGLSSFIQQIYAETPQDSISKTTVSVETSEENTLLSYHISDEQTAHLFSTRVIETFVREGVQGRMVYSHLYVDVEYTDTRQRRRVWELKIPFMNPQMIPQSFVFGAAGTEGQLCLGMASAYQVHYLLLDLHPGTEESEISPPITSGSLHISDLMIHKVLNVVGLSMPGTTIQHISYSSTDGWKLGIKITVLNFDSMLPLELQGISKGDDVQWSVKKLF